MHYLLSVIAETTESGATQSGSPEEYAAVGEFNARLRAEGHWVFAGGLGEPSTATVIDNRRGAAIVTDGPVAGAEDHVGGFWIIDAPDLDAALRMAADGSRACNRRVEVRPFLEA